MDKIGEKIGFIAIFFTMMNISSSPHPLILVLCYLIHESGHFILARLNGVSIRKFKVASVKLSMSYDCSAIPYGKELMVCAGGIIFNFLAVILCLLVAPKNEYTSFFTVCNLSLALMNLYPVSTLDGGGILKCICMMLFSPSIAEKICRVLSFAFVFVLWLCAVYLQLRLDANVSLFFISVFLLIELCFAS